MIHNIRRIREHLAQIETALPEFAIDQAVYYNKEFDEVYYIEAINIITTIEGTKIQYDLSPIHSSVYKKYPKAKRDNVCTLFECEEDNIIDAEWYDEEYSDDKC